MPPLRHLSTSLGLSSLLLTSACQFLPPMVNPSSEPALAIAADQHLWEDLDALLQDRVQPDGPGVAVLVMRNNQVFYAEGHGLRDMDPPAPITAETVFDLASVSKQMTAIAILILLEQGALGLEDPIREHLPEWEDVDVDNPVRISHLLYHTSGLEDYTGDAWDGNDAEFAALDLEAHLTWLQAQAPLADPGAEFAYNNSGYGLLALIVQRVSGQPFARFMDAAIFAPLGMTQTLVYEQLDQGIPNQATGYWVGDDGDIEPSTFPSLMAGDGNVFSSLMDLARYDRALRQNTLISGETLALAFTPGTLADGSPIEDEDEGESYGMGWEVTADYVHHSGSWLGTSTYYRHYLAPEISLVVLSNDEAYDTIALGDDIAQVLGQ